MQSKTPNSINILQFCMKKVIFFVCVLLTLSCQDKPKEYSQEQLERIQVIKDSLSENISKRINDELSRDTAGLYLSPIKIVSYKIVESESGRYRNVRLTYKNVSKQKISAIKFSWSGVDAFGDPADLGNSFIKGYGGGFTDDPLSPGKSETSTWEILSRNARKIIFAWPTEVAFDDGTKWELKSDK